jgi:hypothetical protein
MVPKRIVLETPEGDVLFWGYSQLGLHDEAATLAANDGTDTDAPATVREPSHSGVYLKNLAATGS